MSIYKRGKSWESQVFLKGKFKKSKSGFLNKKEAKAWHNETLAKIILEKGDEITLKVPTFEELITRYCETHLPTIRKATSTRYLTDLNKHILPFFQFYKLNQIDQVLIENFKAILLNKLAPKSVNNCLGLLKSIFKKAKEWKVIANDPAINIKLQKIPVKKYLWWEREEDIRKFITVARSSRYYLAYRLALDLGMRLGEIIGLTKQDINLSLCQIHIHRQWIEKEQKYGPTKHGRDRSLKYQKNSELALLIEQAVQNKSNDAPLFTTSTGKIVRSGKLAGCYFQNLIKKAEIPRIRFHDLRHTFASWFMIHNDDIWELMRILGHSDIQITQKYAHLSSIFKAVPTFHW